MSTADRTLTSISVDQHGLVTRQQARRAGVSDAAVRHLLQRGAWSAPTPRLLRRTGMPSTTDERAMAATLDVGPSTYLAAGSAVAHWGHPGFRVEPVHVMALRRAKVESPLAIVHHPRHLPDPFAAVLRGVPVVRPALALLQIAHSTHPDRLGRIFDWFWSRRLLSAPSVAHELAPLMHRGRAGTAAMREVLAKRPPGYVPPASGLESRFAQIVAAHDLPAMRRQVDVGDEERWCGRVDFLAVDVPLVVEIDSERYHGSLTSTEDDVERQARLVLAGFAVERVWDVDIWSRPNQVAAQIRRAVWDLRAA